MFIHAHAVVGQWLINFQFLTTMKTSFFCMRSCTSLPVEGVLDLEKPGTSAGAAESEWPSMWTSVLPVALISPLLTAENQYCNTVKKRAHRIWENNPTQKLLTYSWVGKLPPILVAWDTIQWLYYWETLRLAIYIFNFYELQQCLLHLFGSYPYHCVPFLREERQLPK